MESKQVEPRISGLDHLVLTVTEISRSVHFYTTCLGMVSEVFGAADGTKRWALKFGSQKINLHLSGEEFLPKAENPSPGSADLCFLSNAPLTDWQVHLRSKGIGVEEGPLPRTGATGTIISIYLRDPDGNLIEISNPA
jgi:catechol 2,3-dioxygenase-like lactoylglutathione lyase family enzyme